MLPMPLTQLILMLKINLWMQCKVAQIKLKVMQTTMVKLVKMYLCSLHNNWPQHNQSPAGLVVSAPQVFYQNWIGKKPEFSGKPEEDAESHPLATRDWMEAHNFPDEVKVICFCLTLTGEARLCYKSLAPLDIDWPALQNKFRWQNSKIGNTPEQLFHAWRTFKFDKNTDTIDSYVLRMSQVAAMLNYGEMQILENFKNTLLY